MQLARWRNLSSLKTRVIPSLTHFSEFHSTPCTCQNWKNKFSSHIGKGQQQPSKSCSSCKSEFQSQIKFITRQKRADAKKALNSLLYNCGSSKFSFEYEGLGRHSNKGQPKSGQRSGGKSQKKTKRKIRRESFCEDFDSQPEQIFQATYGNKCYTWSYSNWSGCSFEHSTSGFEWREHSNRTNKWKNESDVEQDDDDSCSVGSSSDRTILGLPPTGPLKIEDVKNAFRLSALKWHPDKHQGTSQAMAEEKFKLCVNAYKTLCNAFTPSSQ
ncbi:uncharacterized protein LOC106779740 isoform X1 [Vigna radiata var. radiata]|uniref:Uncharacterized protein LOC106779740 isoform X1 n=1 Tax=Vigna radiata var. radiata TaxID=3916 RepID=A0A3Q0EL78_VIGRR|nr:uncharacterized protein LOC106779740 isoform X1 [Vigna radiata var. radiata]XP_022632410.1 uncharacterized protein LOC106779740 isoform X1 [Vigna radiata var. radiata]XP_022632411.1 uncharacterized protein LOC106779740 isoform X1 [Vigna radiata var. radiata]XP_022632412.1 uncharacterized protein LOC106779740 isoform X1 [Vigna radiata var. radiata]